MRGHRVHPRNGIYPTRGYSHFRVNLFLRRSSSANRTVELRLRLKLFHIPLTA